MANSKKVLEKLQKEKVIVPQELLDSADKMYGLTDELAEKRFLDKYGDRAILSEVDPIEEPLLPTLKKIASILEEDDPKGEGSKTAVDKFIENFPKKRKAYEKAIKQDAKFGERGWDTVVETWKRASHDKMLEDIKKARRDATYDGAHAKFASIILPRSFERVANTGDFDGKDLAADLLENAAMAIPGGVFSGLAGKGVAKVAPRVYKYFKGPGRSILEGALKGAGRMSGNILGNAVVPFASEGMDAAIYDDSDTGIEDRADYSVADAIMGTAINQTVNRGIMRLFGPTIDLFRNNGLSRGGTGEARKLLENLGRDFSERGEDFARNVRATNALNIRESGKALPQDIKMYGRGLDPSEAVTLSDADQAFVKSTILDRIDNGDIAVRDAKTLKALSEMLNTNRHRQLEKDIAKNAVELEKAQAKLTSMKEKAGDALIKQGETLKKMESATTDAAKETLKEEADKYAELVKNLWAQTSTQQGIVDNLADNGVKMKNHMVKNLGQLSPEHVFIRNTPPDAENFLSDELVYKTLGENIGDFSNYAKWHGQGKYPAGYAEHFLNGLWMDTPALAINKAGKSDHAKALFRLAPAAGEAIAESSDKVHKAPGKRKAAREVLEIVSSAGDLTPEDREFLGAIQKNPDIVTVGYGTPGSPESQRFKLWLLERGNQLLEGTSAYRPGFTVE